MKVDFETYQLKENESEYPFYNIEHIVCETPYVSVLDLKYIFKDKKHKLKTWGNNIGTSSPHYIGVQKQTPLHTDKGYNKFTHHLILYCDSTFVLRGLNKKEIKPQKGLYFVLDGHSPHQLLAKQKNEGYYLSVSMDSNKILQTDYVIERFLDFMSQKRYTHNCHGKNL
jgi:hypothetical protein